jgi:hypothetical protein
VCPRQVPRRPLPRRADDGASCPPRGPWVPLRAPGESQSRRLATPGASYGVANAARVLL